LDLQTLRDDLERLRERATAAFADAPDLQGLEERDIAFLGKKGELTVVLRGIGGLAPEERPLVGAIANDVRTALEAALAERRAALEASAWPPASPPRRSTSRDPAAAHRSAGSIRSWRRRGRSAASSPNTASSTTRAPRSRTT
jgi:phenylalanyl-tRNA synthetase alpha subunit